MADNINDKELEELNEIYRQKMEALKNSSKHEQEHKPKKAKTIVNAENKSEKPTEKKSVKVGKKAVDSNIDESKKKLATRINIGVCTAFFAITAICLIVLPRPTVSETEKRNLATFPDFTWDAYWSGDYAEDISYYFNDTVPFRDTFTSKRPLILPSLSFSSAMLQSSMISDRSCCAVHATHTLFSQASESLVMIS